MRWWGHSNPTIYIRICFAQPLVPKNHHCGTFKIFHYSSGSRGGLKQISDPHQFQYPFQDLDGDGFLSQSTTCRWCQITFSDHLEIDAMKSGSSPKVLHHHLHMLDGQQRPSVTIKILKRILKLMRITSFYGSTF